MEHTREGLKIRLIAGKAKIKALFARLCKKVEQWGTEVILPAKDRVNLVHVLIVIKRRRVE